MGRRKTKTSASKKISLKLGMDEEEALQAFEQIAQKLNLEIRYEKGDFKGGLCRIGDRQYLILQKNDPAYKKLSLFAQELKKFDLNDVYVVPAIRKFIESETETNEQAELAL